MKTKKQLEEKIKIFGQKEAKKRLGNDLPNSFINQFLVFCLTALALLSLATVFIFAKMIYYGETYWVKYAIATFVSVIPTLIIAYKKRDDGTFLGITELIGVGILNKIKRIRENRQNLPYYRK